MASWPGLVIVREPPAFPGVILVRRELLGTVTSCFKSGTKQSKVFWDLFNKLCFFRELLPPVKLLPFPAHRKLTKGKAWLQAVAILLGI